MIKVIIGIDDTDNPESKGTGTIAEEMCDIIREKHWGVPTFITRHQLFIHPDVPYTSHNSSMIFTAEVKEEIYDEMIEILSTHLRIESADGSDPGICIGKIDKIENKEELLKYAYDAKKRVLTKKMAYDLAKHCNLYLNEEGGDGQGVVGALAGVGLRLDGNDGEIKGGVEGFEKGEIVKVSDFLAHKEIRKVIDDDFNEVPADEEVKVRWKVKPVLHNGEPTLVISKNNKGDYVSMNKEEMRAFGDKRLDTSGCELFVRDVLEETFTDLEGCYNCRYRRWTKESFTCMKGMR